MALIIIECQRERRRNMKLIPKNQNNWWLDPFSELESLQREMNHLFDVRSGEKNDKSFLSGAWLPAVDIHDSKDYITVKADLPGLSKEEIQVSIEEDHLVIKGEKKKDSDVKEGEYRRIERYYGSFYRAIALPSKINEQKIEANYKDGVLEIKLPKAEEAKPKQITVNIK